MPKNCIDHEIHSLDIYQTLVHIKSGPPINHFALIPSPIQKDHQERAQIHTRELIKLDSLY